MKKVLAIFPFESIYPAMNGGMQRAFNLIHQLSRHFRLTIIIHQKMEEFLEASREFPAIKNVAVYSTFDVKMPRDIFNFFPVKLQNSLRYRWYKKDITGSADGHFLRYYPILKSRLKNDKFDIIVLDGLATLNAISIIHKFDKKVKIVYDAHNVDTKLAQAALEKNATTERMVSLVEGAESTLYKRVDAVLACSLKDKDEFLRMNAGDLQVAVVPNGVNVISGLCDKGVQSDHPRYIMFCGFLGSPPNSEGLLWFYSEIWPKVKKQFPDLKLLVLGGGKLPASMDGLLLDNSLEFTGGVYDVKPYYEKCSISMVPLLTGSGTRLKILEAMGFGVPVIATAKGAEGIECSNGHDILIVDEENNFAEKIACLLNNKEKRITIRQNARRLITEKYDWNRIGDDLGLLLSEIVNNK